MRLDLRNRSGAIHVATWQRDAVRIVAGNALNMRIDVQRSGSVLRVRPSMGVPYDEDLAGRRARGIRRERWSDENIVFRVTVPAYLDLELTGTETEVSVEGTRANVTVETVEGAVVVRGGNGYIHVFSVEETVRVEGASGHVDAASSSGNIYLRSIRGDVTAESVDGDIELRDVDSRQVTARTVDGSIEFVGPIHDDGRYHLSTHDGDVTASIPPGTNATVSVANYDGDFETRFPVLLRGAQGHRLDFTLGDGGAVIILESFDGDVILLRGR